MQQDFNTLSESITCNVVNIIYWIAPYTLMVSKYDIVIPLTTVKDHASVNFVKPQQPI